MPENMVLLVRGSPHACEERLLKEFMSKYEEDPFATCLIVPTQALARQLSSKLLEECETFNKASITTLDELARARMNGSPNARYLVTQFASEAIIRHIMQSKKAELPLFSTEGELRQGLVPEVRAFISTTLDFKAEYPGSLGSEISPKNRQLALIRNAYLETIHKKGHIDQHELLAWAAQDILDTRQVWMKNLFIYGIYEPSPVEKELIESICRVCPQTTYYSIFDKDNSVFNENFGWLGITGVEDLPASDRDRAIFSIFGKKDKSPSANITIGSHVDVRTEIRAVCSEIKGLISDGVEPERIALLLPMRKKSAPLVREILDDFQIPSNVRVPVPFSESLVVQGILGLIETVNEDYPADGIVEILSMPYLRFKFEFNGEARILNAADVKSLAIKYKVTGGRERWLEIAGGKEGAEESNDREMQTKAGLSELIKALVSLNSEKKLVDHIRALRKLLERLELGKHMYFQDPVVMRRSKRAFKNYWNLLKDLEVATRVIAGEKMDQETFAAIHRGLIASEEFYPDPSTDKAVKVMGLRAGQLLDFDYVFIPGMVENDIPRTKVMNPFIPEDEVNKLGLLAQKDILRQERYYFLLALLSSSEKVCISTHRNEGDKPVLRSMFLDSLEAAISCQQAPGEDFTRSREGSQWLVGKAISGETVNLTTRPYGLDVSESCLAVNVEEFKRDGPYRTEYDGLLAGEKVLTDVARFHDGHVYSPKQLDMFSFCPFRYYLTYHLRMSPEEMHEEADPVNTGKFVHKVFQRFYQERCSSGRPKLALAERDRAVERLREIAQEEGGNGSSLSWKAYMNQFVGPGGTGMAGIFIDHELKDKLPDLSPKWLELSYGSKEDEAGPASSTEPVAIPLDEGESKFMKMACRIDRADANLQGLFFVLDYKTGTPMRKCQAVADLQIPLYILALEAAKPGSVGIGGGFYYVGSKKNTKIVSTVRDRDYMEMTYRAGKLDARREWDRETLDKFRTEVLPGWLDSMSAGRFSLSQGGSMDPTRSCGPSCEFFGACRFDKARTLEMGLQKGEDEDEEGEEE